MPAVAAKSPGVSSRPVGLSGMAAMGELRPGRLAPETDVTLPGLQYGALLFGPPNRVKSWLRVMSRSSPRSTLRWA